MKTACPHCDSHLTLSQEQMQQRQGMVRCGVCRQVFNALEHLIEDDYPVLQQDDEPVLSVAPFPRAQTSVGSATGAAVGSVAGAAAAGSASVGSATGSIAAGSVGSGVASSSVASPLRAGRAQSAHHIPVFAKQTQQDEDDEADEYDLDSDSGPDVDLGSYSGSYSGSGHREPSFTLPPSRAAAPAASVAHTVPAASTAYASTAAPSAAASAPPTASPQAPAVHIHLNQAPSQTQDYPAHSKQGVTHEIGTSRVRVEHEDDYYIDQAASRRGNGGNGAHGANATNDDAEFTIRADSSYEEEYGEYQTRRSGGMFWFLLVLIALVIFAGQFMYVFRNQISTLIPSARPTLIQMCGFLGCNLGFSKSIEDLELSQVNVGMDSSLKPNAGEQGLRLQAMLQNKSTVASEWPSLVLTLKNSTGAVSNRKIIEPRQYVLPELLMQNFPAGAQVQINLPFILSGAEVSNYELGLFFP